MSGPATSVSKGVFLYRGNKKKLNEEQYIRPTHYLDNIDDCKERMRLYKDASLKIQKQADFLQEEINLQVFNDLISYLISAHRGFVLPSNDDDDDDDDDDEEVLAPKRRKIPSEIPAAALILGVNTPDHDAMFANLITMVKKRVSPHVALLKSVKCPNVKSIIAETVQQLTESNDELDMEEDDDDNVEQNTSRKRTLPTMKIVIDWYKSLYETVASEPRESSHVEFVCLTPAKTPPNFYSPEKMTPEVLTPRRLSVQLRRISLISPQKVQATTPTKIEPPSTPSKSPLNSPTRRLTRMSLMSPPKRERPDDGEVVASPSKGRKVKRGEEGKKEPRRRPIKLKLARVKPKCKPLILIVEDFEAFPAAVLQDYVTILSHHQESIPIVLIFGIATTISSVHRLLPHSVSSHLSIHKFQSMLSSAHLSKLLDKVLLNPDQLFKLDSKVFNFLLDSFLFNDFSVQNFIRSFKLSMMEHFQGNPSSILCLNIEHVPSRLKKLSDEQLDSFRNLHSFRRYVEACPPGEQIRLLEDASFTKEVMMTMLTNLHDYHENFFAIFRCLHALTLNLPLSPLGKSPRELYGFCLRSPVASTQEYSEALLLIRSFSKVELLSNLSRLVQILRTVEKETEDLIVVRKSLLKLSHELKNFDDTTKISFDGDDNHHRQNIDMMMSQKVDMTTLKKILRSGEDKKKSADHQLRQDIINHLDQIFRKYLQCPRSYPLHEVVYFEGVDFLRSRVLPTPRSSLQRALDNPHYHLQTDDLLITKGQVTADLPDLCIAYKLHLECGKLINLFDWLQAFSMILDVDDDEEDVKKPIDRVVQSRFVRSASELQFLGFIKPTRRKTDHVARLTWGNC